MEPVPEVGHDYSARRSRRYKRWIGLAFVIVIVLLIVIDYILEGIWDYDYDYDYE